MLKRDRYVYLVAVSEPFRDAKAEHSDVELPFVTVILS